MKVAEILNIKGNILYTTSPQAYLRDAIAKMVEEDIGSLVVLEKGKLVGMLTFREILTAIHRNGGKVADQTVADACTKCAKKCSTHTRAMCR